MNDLKAEAFNEGALAYCRDEPCEVPADYQGEDLSKEWTDGWNRAHTDMMESECRGDGR